MGKKVKVVGTADIIAGFGPINLLLGPHRRRQTRIGWVLEPVRPAQGCQVKSATARKGRRAESGRLSPRLGCSVDDCLAGWHCTYSAAASAVCLSACLSGCRSAVLGGVGVGEASGECVRSDRTERDRTGQEPEETTDLIRARGRPEGERK